MNTNAEFRTATSSATSRPAWPQSYLRDAGLGLLLLLGTAAGGNAADVSPTAKIPLPLERKSEEVRRRLRAEIEDSLARMKEFGSYPDDWDSNGASAPRAEAIDAALFYFTLLQPWHPAPLATLGRDGDAVLEFDDGNAFASIKFHGDDAPNGELQLELYKRAADGRSVYDEGPIAAENVNRFLRDTLKLPPIQNGNL